MKILKNKIIWCCLMVLVLIILIPVLSIHILKQNYAKFFFGVDIAWDLSEQERELLKPMVENQLKITEKTYAEAVKAETEIFEERHNLTPDKANKLLEKFEKAKEWKNAKKLSLEEICETALYFKLTDKQRCQ